MDPIDRQIVQQTAEQEKLLSVLEKELRDKIKEGREIEEKVKYAKRPVMPAPRWRDNRIPIQSAINVKRVESSSPFKTRNKVLPGNRAKSVLNQSKYGSNRQDSVVVLKQLPREAYNNSSLPNIPGLGENQSHLSTENGGYATSKKIPRKGQGAYMSY